MNIVNVGYDSTNYYVIDQGRERLLVDAGWPGTLPKLQASLKRKDLTLGQIPYLLVTHYHPDHAGLAQELAAQGMRLILLVEQEEGVARLKTYMKPTDGYVEIRPETAVRLPVQNSRRFLAAIGFQGEILSTPGHSDDSVTLVLDKGPAFTGDLPGLGWAAEETQETVRRSWQAILTLGATTVYPGHGPVRPAQMMAQ